MDHRCGDCGFVYDLESVVNDLSAMRAVADRLAGLLERTDVAPTVRPAPDRWSPLEYGCHVRDVMIVQRERVLAAKREHEPVASPMGRDERATDDGYIDQSPADVARQIRDAALLLTGVLQRLDAPAWDRSIVYNYPERRLRPLRWVAAHTHHELMHHLHDVEGQLTD